MKRHPDTRTATEVKLRLVNISEATGLGSIVAQYSHKGKVKWFPTGYRVLESHWNSVKQEIKAGGVTGLVLGEADSLAKATIKATTKANFDIKTVKNTLDAIIYEHKQKHEEKPTIKQLEAQYTGLKPTAEDEAPKRTSVLDALDSFILTYEVKPNSLKNYSALRENLRVYFVDKHAWALETLTLAEFDAFQDWLTGRGFHNTTVERRVIGMKKFLESHKDQLAFHYKELKPKHKVKPPKNLVVVTLSIEELKALEAQDLASDRRHHRVQQLFLLQAWTGLRFSDVVRLNSTHIDGKTVRIDINKTDDFSAVPLFPTAARILAEIGAEPISISNQEYNRVLKLVMNALAEQVPSLLKPITQQHVVGKLKRTTTKQKWEWITTHTARRTFVTMCIQKSIPQHFVMRWSNHSDPRSFRKYQNAMQGEAEAAQQLIEAFNA